MDPDHVVGREHHDERDPRDARVHQPGLTGSAAWETQVARVVEQRCTRSGVYARHGRRACFVQERRGHVTTICAQHVRRRGLPGSQRRATETRAAHEGASRAVREHACGSRRLQPDRSACTDGAQLPTAYSDRPRGRVEAARSSQLSCLQLILAELPISSRGSSRTRNTATEPGRPAPAARLRQEHGYAAAEDALPRLSRVQPRSSRRPRGVLN
jgi:hypothetical protein